MLKGQISLSKREDEDRKKARNVGLKSLKSNIYWQLWVASTKNLAFNTKIKETMESQDNKRK